MEAEARRSGSRTGEKGRAWGTPNDVSNRDLSSWGDGSVLPNGDPTTTHVWGEELLQALGGTKGNHPCELCGCLLSAGHSVSIMHKKIRHNSCIYKQQFVIWVTD